ncbi:hypothetical protein SKAU_G00233190 [Synaphobranchus kaupii]|uniref:Uncharacterized protein n=1 Tax=Synaphobranchus kaupii TaxID=118154 RepID=A0A9Q1F633_SYNKA|nr:hypothetical protein SKAU_G00233190 [Synaphobranchus kaupii]
MVYDEGKLDENCGPDYGLISSNSKSAAYARLLPGKLASAANSDLNYTGVENPGSSPNPDQEGGQDRTRQEGERLRSAIPSLLPRLRQQKRAEGWRSREGIVNSKLTQSVQSGAVCGEH